MTQLYRFSPDWPDFSHRCAIFLPKNVTAIHLRIPNVRPTSDGSQMVTKKPLRRVIAILLGLVIDSVAEAKAEETGRALLHLTSPDRKECHIKFLNLQNSLCIITSETSHHLQVHQSALSEKLRNSVWRSRMIDCNPNIMISHCNSYGFI